MPPAQPLQPQRGPPQFCLHSTGPSCSDFLRQTPGCLLRGSLTDTRTQRGVYQKMQVLEETGAEASRAGKGHMTLAEQPGET